MNRTAIEWTDFTANPLKFHDQVGKTVWGCVHASPGCQHCYAEALARRYGRGGPFNVQTMSTLTAFLDEKELHAMLKSRKIAGKRVFVGDMTDVFGEWVPYELLDRLFAVFALRPDVTWQVLTKRAERMRQWFQDSGRDAVQVTMSYPEFLPPGRSFPLLISQWPLPNVWLGVSCEDQQRADERVPKLLTTPAAVRFISAEPLIGPAWFHDFAHTPRIDWVIVGGESGPNFRPCEVGWIENIVTECETAQVPVFVKQDAHRLPGQQGRIPDEFYRQEFPATAENLKERQP
jgi:protein gp37